MEKMQEEIPVVFKELSLHVEWFAIWILECHCRWIPLWIPATSI